MSTDWKLDLRQLPQRVGQHMDFQRDLTLADALGTPVMAVPAGEKLQLDGSLDVIDQGVLVRVHAQGRAQGQCVRCLDPVSVPVQIDASDVYYLPDQRQALMREGDEDAAYARIIEDQAVDLAGLVIDALVPKLPYAPVCSSQCAGLCPQCGVRLEDVPADHGHEQRDPRWDALAGFIAENKG